MKRLKEEPGGQRTPSRRGPSLHFKVSAISGARDAFEINALERAARHHATRMRTRHRVTTKDHRDRASGLRRSGIMLPDDISFWQAFNHGEPMFRNLLFDAALTIFEDGAVTLFVDEAGHARCSPDVAERMAWARISERLWNYIACEEGWDCTQPSRASAHAVTAALPRTVSLDAQTDIVLGFAHEAFTSRGVIVDWTIHDNGDGNPQALMMVPARLLSHDGLGEKVCFLRDRRKISATRKTWDRNVLLAIERERGRT